MKFIKSIKSLLVASLCFGGLQAGAQSDEQKLAVNQDFASLFNSYRFAQPKNIPWAGSFYAYSTNGTAIGIKGSFRSKGHEELSPIYKYDQLFNGAGKPATQFEKANHSCDHLEGETKQSCQGWWGHCNGWAAAALREREPRKTVIYKGETLEVGHVKGILSELWLSTNSYFVGNTNKSKKTGEWIFNPNDPDYKAFWDVTPKQFFFIFANQIGVQQVGVVIDRFTGDEVWNQPVAGYRVLPIRPQDIGVKEVNGKKLNYADLRMKIYWADDDVYENHVSKKFDINATRDEEYEDSPADEYTARLVKFKMFFDQPLQINGDGTRVLNKPKVVHAGLWAEQENQEYGDADQGHPDFIWQPINPYIVNSGYENPHINWDNVKHMTKTIHSGEPNFEPPPVTPPPPPTDPVVPPPVTPPPVDPPVIPPPPVNPPEAVVFNVVVEAQNVALAPGDNQGARTLIMKVFKRAGLNVTVNAAHIRFLGNGQVQFRAMSSGGVTKNDIRAAFADVGARVISI
jgi:hypothetical protein